MYDSERYETLFMCPKCGNILFVRNNDLEEINFCRICHTALAQTHASKDLDDWANLRALQRINKHLQYTQEYITFISSLREQYCLNSQQFDQAAWDRRVRIDNGEEKVYGAPKPKNVPKCITCGSTDLRKITTGNKVGSVLFWGIFAAGKVAKTWHCNNCGSEW